jgi:exonuclease SbcD
VIAHGVPGWDGFSRPGVTTILDTAIACLPYLDAHHLRAIPEYSTLPPAEAFRILADAFLGLAGGLYIQAEALAPLQVLVIHQGLAGGLMSDQQHAFLGDQSLVVDTRALGAIGFDAVLAGHFHRHQVISTDPLVAYAGSPYRTDFGEEHQAKGYLIVDVDGAGAELAFIETPARRFVTLRDIGPDSEVAESDVEGAVVRVLDLQAEVEPGDVRAMLERLGAFEVQEIRRRVAVPSGVAGGLSEGLAPTEALDEFFADDPDREALVERGREVLAAVS